MHHLFELITLIAILLTLSPLTLFGNKKKDKEVKPAQNNTNLITLKPCKSWNS
jgi:hypothetical protein